MQTKSTQTTTGQFKYQTYQPVLRLGQFFFLFLVIFTLTITASAQSGLNLEIERIDSFQYPVLQFNVTPSNSFGVPVQGLATTAFSVRDDAGPLPITVVERVDPEQPISIMLVLDISGSLVRSGSVQTVRDAAVSLAPGQGVLGERDELGVLFFNIAQDGSRVVLFPAEDPREIQPTFDGGAIINFINLTQIVDNQAGTPLFDAIYRAVQVSEARMNPGRRAIIVMTDGVDEDRDGRPPGSIHADLELAIAEAIRTQIPVFTIGLGSGISAIDLRRIASSTGGQAHIEVSADELEPIFASIANQLKTKYALRTEARVTPDGNEHVLTVSVQGPTGTSVQQTASFTAFYPIAPLIELTYLDNERRSNNANFLPQGVAGSITTQLELFSRNQINRVEYFLNDQPVFQTSERPWSFVWRTHEGLEPNQTHNLRVDVYTNVDTSTVASSRTFPVQVLECSGRCLLIENNPTDIELNTLFYVGGGIVFLLLVIIILLVLSNRSRRENPVPVPVPGSGYYNPSPPTIEQGNFRPSAGSSFPSQSAGFSGGVGQGTTLRDGGQSGQATTLPYGGSVPTAKGAPPIQAPRPYQPQKTVVLSTRPDKLAFLFNPTTGTQYQIKTPKTTIGRDPSNDVSLVDDGSVSGFHAAIILENGNFFVQDLGAANPTEVNGQKVVRQQLNHDDQLTIGRGAYLFKNLDGAGKK